MMRHMRKILNITAIIVAVIGIIFCIVGFTKKNTYSNSKYSWEKSHNAYVNGDAYNYIINGTYFTGYMVLGGSLLVVSSILFATATIAGMLEDTKAQSQSAVSNNNMTSSIPRKTADENEKNEILAKGGWECPDCGRVHQPYETSCICGKSKPGM